MTNWTNWFKFPDPRKDEYIKAPIGPGVYELRLKDSQTRILAGHGKNVAKRMTSLLPKKFCGDTRVNLDKRQFVFEHIDKTEYRTVAFQTKKLANEFEKELFKKFDYLFPR